MKSPLERFLKYASYETTSSEESTTSPSTQTQFDLARVLVDELLELGLKDARVDEHCQVFATLPTNVVDRETPTIGLIAHLDTSCAASGANVKPREILYEGGEIRLESGAVIPDSDDMKALVGKRLIVTDGTTLLGADDKAGIAAIMTALERLLESGAPRPTVRVAFTPDEEIGAGTAHFDVKAFDADYAYTVDGGVGGEINCETFTADKATLVVEGFDVHPGEAKATMINAARVLARILAALPQDRAPETTDERQPFVHVYRMEGGVATARAVLLLRAFDEIAREENKRLLREAADAAANAPAGKAKIELTFEEQYLNMGYFLKNAPEATALLEEATRRAGLEPKWVPIRGGTDGSRLTEMGLPTPNVFTGGRNFHSVLEFLVVEEHEQSTTTLVELAKLWAAKDRPQRAKDVR